MKTHADLLAAITAFENLLLAARRAQRGKRFRGEVAAFNFHLERNLLALQAELRQGTYRPGAYRLFRIREPKERVIAAPGYRDRVVHHALCLVLEPLFDRSFIYDSYACRRGKGTHRALDRYSHFARGSRYVLHLDIEKYFPSIDHEILRELIRRKVRDRHVLALLDAIIASSPDGGAPLRYFPGDTLFTPHQRRRGLPIGALTSQLFANVYLSALDHVVKDRLGWRRYLRYMDDIVCFGQGKEELHRLARAIRRYAAVRLRLHVHADKTLIAPVGEGMRFLGFRVWPGRRRIVNANARRFARRLRRLAGEYRDRQAELDQVTDSVRAWVAHAEHGDTYRLRERILGDIVLTRGR